MSFISWLKGLFSSLLKAFKAFLEVAIPVVQQILIAEFKDAAIAIVAKIADTGLSDTKKREEAFKLLKSEIKLAGKEVADSLVYWLVETAYQYFKKTKETEGEL